MAIEAMLDVPTDRVAGDAVRLQQVVWNLLTNAIKFTPSGGRVAVMLEPAGERVRIRIRDTGIGIDSKFLPLVFDRFAQADNSSTTRSHGGLGLGMAIVRTLVEMHAGTVEVASEGVGKGATFTVELPVLDRTAPEKGTTGATIGGKTSRSGSKRTRRKSSRRDAKPAQSALAGLRILVVEDDADTLDAVAELLTHHGALVSTATSTSQALAAFDASDPEILVLDIGLPGEDGYSLLAKLHSKKPVPAVAVTAFASSEDRARAMAAGFTFHLPKPLDSDVLVSTLSAAARLLPVPPHPAA